MKAIGYILTLAMIIMFDWLNCVTNLCHKMFVTSASSDKTVLAFHLFDAH